MQKHHPFGNRKLTIMNQSTMPILKESQLSSLLKDTEAKYLIQLESLTKSNEASNTLLKEKEEEQAIRMIGY